MRNYSYLLLIALVLWACGGPPKPPAKGGSGGSSSHSNTSTSNNMPRPGTSNSNNSIVLSEVAPQPVPVEIPQEHPILTGEELFEKCNTAVFLIYTSTSEYWPERQGSGFFISSDGIAVSNYHVFENTYQGLEEIKVGNQIYKVDHIIAKSKEEDVIIFKVQNNGRVFNFLPLAEKTPKVGSKAYAIGSPLGMENTFSSGEVSQLREGGAYIQTSAPYDHGSSGGALLNNRGEVIGITSGGRDDSGANLNYAINIQIIRKYIDL